jgi:peptide deformylase
MKKILKKNKVNGIINGMKPLTITEFGNPVLYKKAKDVSLKTLKTPAFKKLVKDMFFTMNKAAGVGLAAPQIDKSIKLALVGITSNNPRYKSAKKEDFQAIIINPKIIEYSKAKNFDWEGCLSLPGISGKVWRSNKIRVLYWDENGTKHIHDYEGFTARVFQHEIDHLYGILFVDRMTDMKTLTPNTERARQNSPKAKRSASKKNRK